MSCKTCWRGSTRPIKPSFGVCNGARRPASPASRGATATTPSLLHLQGVRQRSTHWTMGLSCCPGLGASVCIGRVRLRGRPRRSRSAKRPMAGTSPSPARMCRYNRFPLLDRRRASTWALRRFATLSDGTRIFHPGWYRKAERTLKTAQRRVSRRKKGSNRRRKAVTLLAKAHQTVRRQRRDFHHKTALALVRDPRHDLSRKSPTCQYGEASPSGQVD